jgi:hypothetical protein
MEKPICIRHALSEPRHCAPQLMLGRKRPHEHALQYYRTRSFYHWQTSVIRLWVMRVITASDWRRVDWRWYSRSVCFLEMIDALANMDAIGLSRAVLSPNLGTVTTGMVQTRYCSYFHPNADKSFILHPYSTTTFEFLHPAILSKKGITTRGCTFVPRARQRS